MENKKEVVKIDFDFKGRDDIEKLYETIDVEEEFIYGMNFDLEGVEYDEFGFLNFKVKHNEESLKNYQKYIYGFDKCGMFDNEKNETYVKQVINFNTRFDGIIGNVKSCFYNELLEEKNYVEWVESINKMSNLKCYFELQEGGGISIYVYEQENENDGRNPKDFYNKEYKYMESK